MVTGVVACATLREAAFMRWQSVAMRSPLAGQFVAEFAIAIDSAWQRGQFLRRNSSLMLPHVRSKRPAQVGGRIAVAASSRDAIAEYLRCHLMDAMGKIMRTAMFNLPDCRQQHWGRDIRNRSVSNLGEQVGFQAT